MKVSSINYQAQNSNYKQQNSENQDLNFGMIHLEEDGLKLVQANSDLFGTSLTPLIKYIADLKDFLKPKKNNNVTAIQKAIVEFLLKIQEPEKQYLAETDVFYLDVLKRLSEDGRRISTEKIDKLKQNIRGMVLEPMEKNATVKTLDSLKEDETKLQELVTEYIKENHYDVKAINSTGTFEANPCLYGVGQNLQKLRKEIFGTSYFDNLFL